MSNSCQVVYGNIELDVLSLCKNNEVVSIFVLLVECTLVLLPLLFIFLNCFSFQFFRVNTSLSNTVFAYTFRHAIIQSRDIIDCMVRRSYMNEECDCIMRVVES